MKYLPSTSNIFVGLEKLQTYQMLNEMGCPVLKSVLIEENDVITDKDIENIKCHLNSDYCTMRYQYITPNEKPVRGGNRVKINHIEIRNSKTEGALSWLLESTNRLTNIYGLNMYFNRNIDKLIFECVGKGFDTSNINRGDMNPHQTIEFRLRSPINFGWSLEYRFPIELGWYAEWWKFAKFSFMSTDEYNASKKTRLRNLHLLGYKDTEISIFDKTYNPLSVSLIENLLAYAGLMYNSELLSKENEFTANCSVLEGCRFVFWDIATPNGKINVFRAKIKKGNR